jgi:thiamine-phosphate pyrophosphorylase
MSFPRFYPILDTSFLRRNNVPVLDAARSILNAGARILQFRHKQNRDNDFFTPEMLDQAGEIAQMCRASGAIFIINDRADIAAMIGAGVHVGQDDLTPSQVRPIVGSGATIGFSTHNAAQLQQAASEPADYLAIGPIFSTTSKENPDPVVGVDQLRDLRALTNRPLVAIGGITRANAHAVLTAGADSVAVISDLYSGDIGRAAAEWIALVGD